METTGARSYSVGINMGPHSGASIPSHLHIHVVPRYPKDSSVVYWPNVETQKGKLHAPDVVIEAFEKKFGVPPKQDPRGKPK